MPISLIAGSYIIAGLAFILALAGLSKHETSKQGNVYGIIGMTVALFFTILGTVFATKTGSGFDFTLNNPKWGIIAIICAMAIGGSFGV
ncbi:MAG: NAD(P)(+) transhydrogenase (Re/Si-specific) subunit beta, partial [Micrococcales bacterium]|nr:NAD(P)(+) transhydrogenase (Re/Si-specific) subunit beta [Micrococcales bacterium]